LKVNESLEKGEKLTSAGGRFIFIFQDDGNFVLYDYDFREKYDYEDHSNRRVLFDAESHGGGACLVTLMPDGHLVISNATNSEIIKSVSKVKGQGNQSSILKLQDDGNAVILSDGKQIWETKSKQWDPFKLEADAYLETGQWLISPNLRYRFMLHETADLTLHDRVLDNCVVWSSYSNPGVPTHPTLRMHPDGNAIYMDIQEVFWASDTANQGDKTSVLKVQDDGDVVIFSKGERIWRLKTRRPLQIKEGESLNTADTLFSPNGRFQFRVKEDGNLVINDAKEQGRAIWESGVKAPKGQAIVQGDGNLVVYQDEMRVWAGKNAVNGTAVLVLQDDGVAVLTAGGKRIWASPNTPR
jgi:hypothetical protein